MSALELVITAIADGITAAELTASKKVTVERHAGKFTWEELSKKSHACPAIFISCLGWREIQSGEPVWGVESHNGQRYMVNFAVGVVTKNAKSSEARNIEAQYICEQLSNLLNDNDWAKDNVSIALKVQAQGLFIPKAEQNNLSMWLVTWQHVIGLTPFDIATQLDNFLRYYASHMGINDQQLAEEFVETLFDDVDGRLTEGGFYRETEGGLLRVGEAGAMLKKISEMVHVPLLLGNELIEVVQDGFTKAASIDDIVDFFIQAVNPLPANAPITPGTATKITYDENGLVVSGAQATKADVGLPYVDNTPDNIKPVSTPQAEYIAAQIAALVNGSPAVLDTLYELASALGNDQNFATTVTNAIAAKQDSLGFTPENSANKQSDLTPSSTKYPVVDAVIAGLLAKVDKVAGYGLSKLAFTDMVLVFDGSAYSVTLPYVPGIYIAGEAIVYLGFIVVPAGLENGSVIIAAAWVDGAYFGHIKMAYDSGTNSITFTHVYQRTSPYLYSSLPLSKIYKVT